jgi:hypothetical protein
MARFKRSTYFSSAIGGPRETGHDGRVEKWVRAWLGRRVRPADGVTGFLFQTKILAVICANRVAAFDIDFAVPVF